MLYVLLFASAVVPAVLLVWFFHARDTFPEPPRVLWATFGLGCLSVVPAVALGMTVEPVLQTRDALSVAAFQAFVIAALCEEGAKLSVLLGYSFRRSEFDEPMDGIVYGAAASLGFAGLENILYVLEGGFGIAVLRGLLSVPGHATYGAVMGYYVGRARFDRENRWRLIGLGLLSAVLLHGFYDFPLMLLDTGESAETTATASSQSGHVSGEMIGGLLLLALSAVVIGWTWSLSLVKRVRQEQAQLLALQVVPSPVFVGAEADAAAGTSLTSPTTLFPPQGQPSAQLPKHPAPGSRVAAWVAVGSGGLLGAMGALIVAVAIAAILFGEVKQGDLLYFVVGIALLGGAPAVLGSVLLVLGVRALNRARPALPRPLPASGILP